MTIQEMQEAADLLAGANIGYDQWQRWSFFNRDTKEVVAGMEADCASTCGAIAVLGGYDADLSNPFWTGTFKERLTAAGFTAVPFTSLAQVRPGDFILNTRYHVEFAYTASRWFSARIDERGKITGGKAGNQTGTESGFVRPYVYSKGGWDWILRPPAENASAVTTPSPAPAPAPAPSVSKADQNVLAYQRRQNQFGAAGLFEDGVDGPITQAWRAWVAILQRELRAWKGAGGLLIDGDYGSLTHTAVATVQRRNNLYVDGLAQAKTISFMRAHGSPVPDRPATR